MEEILRKNKIIAILRGIPEEYMEDYVKTVFDAGIHAFEVAMNSEKASEQIKYLRKLFGNSAFIGAGTVINEERCIAAKEAGAQFFLTPSVSEVTLRYCRENDIPLLPGVMTPTDVAKCLEYGYTVMKLFPASEVTDGYIKSLRGPFNDTKYVAVGGVTFDNMNGFFKSGYIGVGIGTNLIPNNFIQEKRWEDAKKYIKDRIFSR